MVYITNINQVGYAERERERERERETFPTFMTIVVNTTSRAQCTCGISFKTYSTS
jgi:hypothetical protein